MISDTEQEIRLEPSSAGLDPIDLLPYFRASKKFGGSKEFSRQVRIGRGKDCDIVLPDTVFYSAFSREHCVFLRQGPGSSPLSAKPRDFRESTFPTDRFYIRDMGSRNGTALNGVQLEPNRWVRIEHGQRVLFGVTSGAGQEYIFRARVVPIFRKVCSEKTSSSGTDTSSRKRLSIYDQDLFGQIEEHSGRASGVDWERHGRHSGASSIKRYRESAISIESVAHQENGKALKTPVGARRALFGESSAEPPESHRMSHFIQSNVDTAENPEKAVEEREMETNCEEDEKDAHSFEAIAKNPNLEESPESSPLVASFREGDALSTASENTAHSTVLSEHSVPQHESDPPFELKPSPAEKLVCTHQRAALDCLISSAALSTKISQGIPQTNHTPPHSPSLHTSFLPMPSGMGKKIIALLFFDAIAQRTPGAIGVLLVPHDKIILWRREYHKWQQMTQKHFPGKRPFRFCLKTIDFAGNQKDEMHASAHFAKASLRQHQHQAVLVLLSFPAFHSIISSDALFTEKYPSLVKGDLLSRDLSKWTDAIILDDDFPINCNQNKTENSNNQIYSALREFHRASQRLVLCHSVPNANYHAFLFPDNEALTDFQSNANPQSTQAIRRRLTLQEDQTFSFSVCENHSKKLSEVTQFVIRVHPSDLQQKILGFCLEAFQKTTATKKGLAAQKLLQIPFPVVLERLCAHSNLFFHSVKQFLKNSLQRSEEPRNTRSSRSNSRGKLPQHFVQINFTTPESQPKQFDTNVPKDTIDDNLIEKVVPLSPYDPFCNLSHNPRHIVILNVLKAVRLHRRKCALFMGFEESVDIFASLLESTPIVTFYKNSSKSDSQKLSECQNMLEGVHFVRLRGSDSSQSMQVSFDAFQRSDGPIFLLAPLHLASAVRRAHLRGSIDICIDDSSCSSPLPIDAIRCVSHVGNNSSTSVYHMLLAKTHEEIRHTPSIRSRMRSLPQAQRNATLWGYLTNAWNSKWVGVQRMHSVLDASKRVTWRDLQEMGHPLVVLQKMEKYIAGVYRVEMGVSEDEGSAKG